MKTPLRRVFHLNFMFFEYFFLFKEYTKKFKNFPNMILIWLELLFLLVLESRVYLDPDKERADIDKVF